MNDIRKLVLSGKGGQIRKLLLTSSQVGLLKSIKGEISSRELADRLNTSVQNASQKLLWLEHKGYLERRQENDPTGGLIYIYKRVKL